MTEPERTGNLYVVSTPIGNMGDFSFRAVEVLKSVALILAEDTRHTRHLLDHYSIDTPVAAHHEHNEAKTSPGIVARLARGESCAIVSDAGTPLLSDPGARLVRSALDAGIRVIPIPGASALLAAVVASGLDAEHFTFFGFLTRSGRARRETLDEITGTRHTVVLYESPNRLVATLAELESLGNGARPAAVAREMTKQFEEVQRGTVSGLRAYYESHPPRGEIVLMLGGRTAEQVDDELVRRRLHRLRAEGMSARDAAVLVSREFGVSRNRAYRLSQATHSGEENG